MTTTTDDVRSALGELSTVEHENSDLAGGIRAVVDESEAGDLFRVIRVNDLNAEVSRLNDSLVAHIEAEESGGLGDLFG